MGKLAQEAADILDDEKNEPVDLDKKGTKEDPKLTSDPDKGDAGGRSRFTDDDIQEHIDNNEKEHAEFRQRLDALESAIKNRTTDDDDDDDDGA